MESSKFKKLLMAAAITVVAQTGHANVLPAVANKVESPKIYERLNGEGSTDLTKYNLAVVQKQKQVQQQKQKAAMGSEALSLEVSSEGFTV